jgi:molybdopterin-guanine dinucleotide biosynthesis protein MobB
MTRHGSSATAGTTPPVVSVVGRKNSGKTTLVVALAAELQRRGLRVASIKHSHHDFEVDQPGKDSWRHFHEGGVEAVLIASSSRIALVMRATDADQDPEQLIARYFAGDTYDVVLVEAFTCTPFPRIEVFRTAVHPSPLYDAGASAAPEMDHAVSRPGPYLAMVTDAPHTLTAPFPVVALRPDNAHVGVLAGLIQVELQRQADQRSNR